MKKKCPNCNHDLSDTDREIVSLLAAIGHLRAAAIKVTHQFAAKHGDSIAALEHALSCTGGYDD